MAFKKTSYFVYVVDGEVKDVAGNVQDFNLNKYGEGLISLKIEYLGNTLPRFIPKFKVVKGNRGLGYTLKPIQGWIEEVVMCPVVDFEIGVMVFFFQTILGILVLILEKYYGD